jgi:formate/nitrite transporter FocA (FNT family)
MAQQYYDYMLDDRFTTTEILERVLYDADEEISRDTLQLFFSSLAAGFSITLTVLLFSSMTALSNQKIVASLLYPLGFVYIIIGNYQLYTENTLPPVALTIERLSSVPAMLIMWIVILLGNILGGTIGAMGLAYGNVLSPGASTALMEIAMKGIEADPITLFFKALFAGVIVAGVVWVDMAVTDSSTRLMLVYMAFLSIPLGNLFHVVVSFTEMSYLIFIGEVPILSSIISFPLPVLLGNTVGGTLFVTVINYFQSPSYSDDSEKLSIRDWLLTINRGRKHKAFEDDN